MTDQPAHGKPTITFTCPECGGAEFRLIYRPPLSPDELAEAPPAGRAALLFVADDSPIFAYCCAAGCDFRTSVTNIEIGLCADASS